MPPPSHDREIVREFWTTECSRFLKAELVRRGVTYEELARRLSAMGQPETVGSITVKINRGRFSAPFLLAATAAINAELVMRDADAAVMAHRVFRQAIGRTEAGSVLGQKGGVARRDKLSPERRTEIARMAAAKRWQRP